MSSGRAAAVGIALGAAAFLLSLPQQRPIVAIVWSSFVGGALLFLVIVAADRLILNEPGFQYALIGDALLWMPLGGWVFGYSLWDGASIAAAMALAVLVHGFAFLASLVVSRMMWPVILPRIRDARRGRS